MEGLGSSVGRLQVLKGSRGARYVSLFSCYDFRVEASRFGVTKQALQRIVSRLSELPPTLYSHIRDVRVFGFKTIVVEVGGAYHRVAMEEPERLMELLPFPQFVSSIAVPMTDTVLVAYSVPEELVGLVEREIATSMPDAEVEPAETLPVRNCTGSLALTVEAVRRLEAEFEAAVREPPRISRPHMLDFIIVALLDQQPLLTLNRMRDLSQLPGSDGVDGDASIRYKYLLKHYRMLSSIGAVGRVRLSKLYWDSTIPVLVKADASSAPRVYAIAASVLATSRIVVGEEHVYAALSLPAGSVSTAVRLLPSDSMAVMLRGGLRMPFPYEYFNPRSGRWDVRQVNIVDELRRHRLLAQPSSSQTR